MGVFYGEEGMGEGARELYEAGIRSIKNCFGGNDIKVQRYSDVELMARGMDIKRQDKKKRSSQIPFLSRKRENTTYRDVKAEINDKTSHDNFFENYK